MAFKIVVQSEDFDMGGEVEKIRTLSSSIGGIVAFCGLCRSEGGRLSALEIEHYPGMAEKRIKEIVDDAASRWSLNGATVIHRFGTIKVGEQIVLVVTASPHRREAFDAANFIMDFLKTEAPFWKKEHLVDGTPQNWVEAKDADLHTQEKWQKNSNQKNRR
ncbi:molybdenum cofactor biosynthesis protein MoaE [uncultured Bartonella sp.]|uniref:molybdenum cofactor biosynthesis protein MoaE n=1 Tax=uncultured Bartonella sp. TaxID=104108 RepID=UPI0025E836C0|nr:molybdenum cofactor biosynthesis protein MoaE [uncultured Bartonella sp.]